jgi:hypothetical protein
MKKKIAVVVLVTLLVALLATTAAFAAATPPASCDSGHGAFGAFSHHSGGWIPVDAKEDGGLGHATGPNNSGYSAYCN